MAYPIPAFTPQTFYNAPNATTPLDASHLNGLQQNLATYTQTVIAGLDAYLEGLGAGSPAISSSLSRTTSGLRDLPHIKDYGAKGGAATSATGAATASNVTFTDATKAPFTSADTGKTIIIYGAGTGGKTHTTTITYVSASQVTLAAAPITSVGTANYVYGWDDTTAINNAINNVTGPLASGHLSLTNDTYLATNITPKPGLVLWGYGAHLYKIPSTGALIYGASTDGTTVNGGAQILGLHMHGEGSNGAIANYAASDTGGGGVAQFAAAIWLQQWSDVLVRDCLADGFVDSGYIFRDSQRVRCVDSDVTNSCVVQGRNAISFCDSSTGTTTVPATDFTAIGCKVRNCAALGIQYGNNYTSPTVPTKFIAVGNTVDISSGNGCGIGCELQPASGKATVGREVVIANNTINNTSTASFSAAIYCIDDSATPNTDATQLQDILIAGNKCTTTTSGQGAITVYGSRIMVANNIINALGNGTTSGPCILVYNNTSGAMGTAQYLSILGNICHMGSTATTPGIYVAAASAHLRIAQNHVYSDAGFSTGNDGIKIGGGCSFVDIHSNLIESVGANGINLVSMSDVRILGNVIYNPNAVNTASTSAGCGITVSGTPAGTRNVIAQNQIYDDRGTPRMLYAYNGPTTGVLPHFHYNNVSGCKTSVVNAYTALGDIRGNVTDTPNAFPTAPGAVTVGASPVTLTNSLPCDAIYSLSGGTVSAVTRTRNGGAALAVTTSGDFLLKPGDALTVTYSVAPTCNRWPQP